MRRAGLARLNCVGADAGKWRGVGPEQQKPQPARPIPVLRPSLAAVAATLPTRLRRVAARQHNVALCKPPRCHGACKTPSAPRAGAGTRRASASLRITHIHVAGGKRCALGIAAPSIVVLRRAHPCARLLRHRLRVARGCSASLRQPHRHALARVLRTPTPPRARYAPTLAPARASAARLNAVRSSRSRFVAAISFV